MGIILSGDFNPDEVIAKIDKTFGQMQSHSRSIRKRSSYNSSIIKEIVGPDAENLTIGYRQETKTKMFF
jgi:predicted Zn-dependent peptidase